MERTEIFKKPMRCQSLWQLVRSSIEVLLEDAETSALSAGYCTEAKILLPDDAMELVQE